MRITFLLTGSGHRPVGGFKVVYEYANRLAKDGHQVTLVHPQMVNIPPSVVKRLALRVLFYMRKVKGNYHPRKWFSLDDSIALKWVFRLKDQKIPDGDVIIATGWGTAWILHELPRRVGEKYYLLQGLETWASSDPARVLATWKLPLRKIVISKWLKDQADAYGERACYVPNGLDFDAFGLDVPMEQRHPATVMFLNHWRPIKGTKDALEALKIARREVPDLQAILFGVPKRPPDLPAWVTYYRMPSQRLLRELYNSASIFVAPSHSDGWGLTACEAMMSGCAVVATDIGGHREFAIHGRTALIVAAGDVPAMANAVVSLVSDDLKRAELGNVALRHIKQFTWERAYSRFIGALTQYEECS